MTKTAADLLVEAAEDIECPARIFEEHKIHRVVAMLGSGRDGVLTDRYRSDAFDIASRITAWSRDKSAEEKLWVCSGGKGGIMAAVSEGVASEGGLPLGFGFDLKDHPPNRHQDRGTTHLFWFPGLRNHWLFERMSALVAFPGGLGTLTEVYDALLHTQLSLCPAAPIFLYGSTFWQRQLNLPQLLSDGLISLADVERVEFVDTIDTVMSKLPHG